MTSAIIVAGIALFLGGIAIGVLAIVAREVRREDRLCSLPESAPSMMSRNARRMNGFGRRDLEMSRLTAGRRAAA